MWLSSESTEKTNAISDSGLYSARHVKMFTFQPNDIVSLQVYLPSFMFVVTSWVSFLIKPEVVPGR